MPDFAPKGSHIAAMPCDGRQLLIAVHKLSKCYGRATAVAGVALALRSGEIWGFVGANGAGKTTTLRMLAGILKPDGGSGQVLGFDLQREAAAIRERVGYMSQRLSLYPELSVFENLRFRAAVYGLRNPRAVAESAICEFGLVRWARNPPDSSPEAGRVGFSSPRRCCIRPVSCCSTSRQRVSIRQRVRRYGGAWKTWRRPARA
jgi:ABC-type sugar transport system ATPase subunit